MSRFYFPYAGNKRKEWARVAARVGPASYDVIAEPFAGSAAVSLEAAAAARAAGRQLAVSLNDADAELVAFLRAVAAEGSAPFFEYVNARLTRADYDAEQAAAGPRAWFYRRRVTRQWGRKGAPAEFRAYARTARQAETDAVLAAAEISCGDWLAHAERFADNPRALVFLDPPYFASHNRDYAAFAGPSWREDGTCADATQVYVDIADFLARARCGVVLITNANAVMRRLYGAWAVDEYDHDYATMVKRPEPAGPADAPAEKGKRRRVRHLLVYKPPAP